MIHIKYDPNPQGLQRGVHLAPTCEDQQEKFREKG